MKALSKDEFISRGKRQIMHVGVPIGDSCCFSFASFVDPSYIISCPINQHHRRAHLEQLFPTTSDKISPVLHRCRRITLSCVWVSSRTLSLHNRTSTFADQNFAISIPFIAPRTVICTWVCYQQSLGFVGENNGIALRRRHSCRLRHTQLKAIRSFPRRSTK